MTKHSLHPDNGYKNKQEAPSASGNSSGQNKHVQREHSASEGKKEKVNRMSEEDLGNSRETSKTREGKKQDEVKKSHQEGGKQSQAKG